MAHVLQMRKLVRMICTMLTRDERWRWENMGLTTVKMEELGSDWTRGANWDGALLRTADRIRPPGDVIEPRCSVSAGCSVCTVECLCLDAGNAGPVERYPRPQSELGLTQEEVRSRKGELEETGDRVRVRIT